MFSQRIYAMCSNKPIKAITSWQIDKIYFFLQVRNMLKYNQNQGGGYNVKVT